MNRKQCLVVGAALAASFGFATLSAPSAAPSCVDSDSTDLPNLEGDVRRTFGWPVIWAPVMKIRAALGLFWSTCRGEIPVMVGTGLVMA